MLDDFEGLGAKRKEALLKKFQSISKIKSASVEELEQVEGIGHETALRLREFLDKIAESTSKRFSQSFSPKLIKNRNSIKKT